MASLEMVENKFVWYHLPISRVTNVSKVDARYMQMAPAGNNVIRTIKDYYLRAVEPCKLCASARKSVESLNWVLVVEYMDRAQGPTVDFSTQNLLVTLP